MDTFNFSFFDEKPHADEGAPPAPASDAAHEPPLEDDPFADFGFDPIDDESAPHLLADEPTPIAPPHPPAASSASSSAQADEAFRLDVASPLDAERPNWATNTGSAPDVGDISFAPPALPLPLDIAPIEANAPASEAEKPAAKTGFAGYKLDDAPAPASPEAASSFVAPPSPFAQRDEELTDLPEVRASVTPAVFLTPAPTAPAPAPLIAPPEADKGVQYVTADDPFATVAPLRPRLRVAILGASGIGKDHARWMTKNGGEVVAFLGTSEDSIERTRAHLAGSIGFAGEGYSDLGELLAKVQPQAAVIASPSPFHYAQAMQCLEAGVHVLCEKPLVYSPGRSKRENMDGAKELLRAAAKRELVLATQLQYGAATPIVCRLAGVSPLEVGDFAMEIETLNVKSPRDPKELWIELASHPLSVAQYLAGEGAQILKDSVQMSASQTGVTTEIFARFGVQCEGGRLLMCRAIVRWFDKIVDNRPPRRRFSFNGRVVQYAGVKGEGNSYIAQYVAPDGYISHYPDPVDYLVGNFVRTCWKEDDLILSAEQGVQNLDWLLTTADKIGK